VTEIESANTPGAAPAGATSSRDDMERFRRFGLDYREEVALRNGRRVRIRVPRPKDRKYFQRGFAALSPLSRRRRFHMTKKSLTEAELDYLTDPEGEDHYALGAIALGWAGREKTPVGVARFFRISGDPERAEFAVVVVDAWQNQGIGQLLLRRLLAAAAERGILVLQAQVMADNLPILHILRGVPDGYRHRLPGGVIEIDVPVSMLG
jgi:RimJ/RimL family protein N-acetyltransferase